MATSTQQDDSRAVRALTDVVATEEIAPGMMRVVTWSDEYYVDARGDGCLCPDKEYNLDGVGLCKHELAAVLTDTADAPDPYIHMVDAPDRPENCMCHATDQGLPCFPCFDAGHDDPNPDAPEPLEVDV